MRISDGFPSAPASVKGRIVSLYALLICVNAGAWIWALMAFHHHPVLLGTALLAYTFGLRHAVDADHIAAIDNVTRKLIQQGKRPVAIGLFFSLGHSTVVFGLSALIALTSVAIKNHFASFQAVGAIIGTSVSAFFLLAIATANLVVLLSVYRTFQRVKRGGRCGGRPQSDSGPKRFFRTPLSEFVPADRTQLAIVSHRIFVRPRF